MLYAAAPAFEVASVKHAPPSPDNQLRVMMGGDAGRVNYSNVTLRNIMTRAYNVKNSQITGPDWLNSDRYDIVAKLPPDTPREQIPLMLQTLLEDRFKLALHREKKVMPVYALVAGKNGAKLKEAEAVTGMRVSMGPKGRQLAGKVTLAQLCDMLSNWLDRPVLDVTEIKGIYDIDLEWTDDNQRGMMFGPGGGGRPEGPEGKRPPESSEGPSIFTAVQEKLGLRLEARKSEVDILIVDHAERAPSEN
jgi:uncharacterized protein (TIGR03435 family)